MILYLQRNGTAAESRIVELDVRSTGEAILATAKSLGCDLLIKERLNAEPIEANDIWRGDPTCPG